MLDTQVFYLFNNLAGKSSLVDSVIIFCASYLAYGVIAAFLTFLYVTDYPWRQKLEIAYVALVAVVVSRGLLTEAIRFFFPRARPFDALHLAPAQTLFTDAASSFPSGHATFFFALATVVYLYNKRWGIWFFITTTIIVFARVAAGVHYPSDIAAGAIIGIGSAYISYLGVRRLTRKRAD